MHIITFDLLETHILSKPEIYNNNQPLKKDAWEINAEFGIGYNYFKDVIQQLEITIHRRKENKVAYLNTVTTFKLLLEDSELMPTTKEDFEFHNFFMQIGLAHNRMIFRYEMKNTIFSNDWLPIESNEKLMERTKQALKNSLFK